MFGFVGCFGESAVPVIMGGVGYQLMGNTITSTMDVLNIPLAAACPRWSSRRCWSCSPSGIWSSTCGDSSARSCAGGCRRMGPARRFYGSRSLIWGYIVLVLAFLYVPLIPPVMFSLAAGTGPSGGWTLRWYKEMWRNPMLSSSMVTTLEIGAVVAVAATILGLAAAMAIRELRIPRLVLLLMLLPLFIPGVSMGLATRLLLSGTRDSALALHNRHGAGSVGAALRDARDADRDVDLRPDLSGGSVDDGRRPAGGRFST